jgi:hypothetical protein
VLTAERVERRIIEDFPRAREGTVTRDLKMARRLVNVNDVPLIL